MWLALIFTALLESMIPIYVMIALLLFEGITNWRIPLIVTRVRYGKNYKHHLEMQASSGKYLGKVEAERMLRFVVVACVLLPVFVMSDLIWFLPWFVTGMLILAGITNICPMVMVLRKMGMR